MNSITHFFGEELTQAIGWTILHSLWQGMVIALLLTILLIVLRKRPPHLRYLTGLGALMVMLVLALFTFFSVYQPSGEVASMTTAAESTALADAIDSELLAAEPASQSLTESTWPALQTFVQYFDHNMPLVVLIWLLGMFVLTLKMLGELAYIQHLRYYRAQTPEKKWLNKMQDIAGELGIHQMIRMKESFRVSTPMVVGYLKPVILLPAGLLANLTPLQVESVLAHELAHIKRYDYLVNLFQSLVEILLFFNPAVWWISSFIRSERENCCDDMAIDYTQDEVAFVKTLARLEEWRIGHAGLALAFTGNGSGVLGRIQRILNNERSASLPFRLFWSAAILVFCLTMVALRPAISADQSLSDSIPTDLIEAVEEPEMEEYMDREDGPDMVDTELEEPEIEMEEPDFDHDYDFEVDPVFDFEGDSIPEEIKKLRKEILVIRQEQHKKQAEMEKQIHQLEVQLMEKDQIMEQKEIENQQKQLELQKRFQELLARESKIQQEHLMRENEMQQMLLEKEQELRQVEHDLAGEEGKEKMAEMEKKIRALSKERLLKEQEMERMDLEKEKRMLEVQKKAIELQNKSAMLEQEGALTLDEIRQHKLQIEQQVREIEMQRRIEEHELQGKMKDLELKMIELREKQGAQ